MSLLFPFYPFPFGSCSHPIFLFCLCVVIYACILISTVFLSSYQISFSPHLFLTTSSVPALCYICSDTSPSTQEIVLWSVSLVQSLFLLNYLFTNSLCASGSPLPASFNQPFISACSATGSADQSSTYSCDLKLRSCINLLKLLILYALFRIYWIGSTFAEPWLLAAITF